METIHDIIELDEIQWDIEARVLKEMGLPYNCLTLDGDHVPNNSSTYTATDDERAHFKEAVQLQLANPKP